MSRPVTAGVLGVAAGAAGERVRGRAAADGLLLSILLIDLLLPILNWKAGLPDQVRWVAYALVALAIAIGCARLIRGGRFPGLFLLVPVLTVLGAATALVNGQGAMPTLWGWWLMFQWPLIGLYASLKPDWPESFPVTLQRACTVLLLLEVLVQVGQYLGGQVPGDQLAGTLSWESVRQGQGAQHLALVVLFIVALALGRWVATGEVRGLILVVGLGALSSLLSESKAFLPAVPFLGAIAAVVRHRLHGLTARTLAGLAGLLICAAVFAVGLDAFVAPTTGSQATFGWLSDWTNLSGYLESVEMREGFYDIGRNYEIQSVWRRISAHPDRLLLGEGLGARAESKTLGTAGTSLLESDLGLFTGNSLGVILGELGLLGVLALALFGGGVIGGLWRCAREARPPGEVALSHGLLLYTLLWPFSIWYTSAWALPVSSLLYWTSLGYIFRRRTSRLGLDRSRREA